MVVEGRDKVIPARVGLPLVGRHVGVVFVEVGHKGVTSVFIGVVPVDEG